MFRCRFRFVGVFTNREQQIVESMDKLAFDSMFCFVNIRHLMKGTLGSISIGNRARTPKAWFLSALPGDAGGALKEWWPLMQAMGIELSYKS